MKKVISKKKLFNSSKVKLEESLKKNINGIVQLIHRYIELHNTNNNKDFIVDFKKFKNVNFTEPMYLPIT